MYISLCSNYLYVYFQTVFSSIIRTAFPSTFRYIEYQNFSAVEILILCSDLLSGYKVPVISLCSAILLFVLIHISVCSICEFFCVLNFASFT